MSFQLFNLASQPSPAPIPRRCPIPAPGRALHAAISSWWEDRLTTMAPPHESSQIRVFIRWHDQTVFAGEEVKCTITFKNVASSPEEQQRQRQQLEQAQQANAQSDRHRLTSSLHTRAKPSPNLSSPPLGKGHRRAAHSVSVPASDFRSRSGSVQWSSPGPASDGRQGHAHKRSLSILSFGSAVAPADDHTLRNEGAIKSPRPLRAHNRSASLQISPRVHGSPIPGPPSGTKTKEVPMPLQLAYLDLSCCQFDQLIAANEQLFITKCILPAGSIRP